MQKPRDEIHTFLDDHKVPYHVLTHKPVYTSEQAAAVRGLSLSKGAKSLLLKSGEQFILCIIPGNMRLDSKKVKKITGRKNLRFATSEEVVAVMGCEIGACYPFGNLLGIPMLVDQSFEHHSTISFNPGSHVESIKILWKDYVSVVKPNLVDIIS